MIDTLKELTAHQFEAALSTLGICIEQCPESLWNGPIANLAFCQVAFHTLFFTDYYLGDNEDAFRQQRFHRNNQHFFRNYEELQPRQQELLYEKSGISDYLAHCRNKAIEVVAAETADRLTGPCGFRRYDFSRAELHVCNIRHIQHHAAQLSLRLRLDANQEVPWVSSGCF